MRYDTTDCDRCGVAVNERRNFDYPTIAFAVPTDEPETYETTERALCDSCRCDLLEFIDGDAPDRSELISGKLRVDVATALKRASNDLESTAEDVIDAND